METDPQSSTSVDLVVPPVVAEVPFTPSMTIEEMKGASSHVSIGAV